MLQKLNIIQVESSKLIEYSNWFRNNCKKLN